MTTITNNWSSTNTKNMENLFFISSLSKENICSISLKAVNSIKQHYEPVAILQNQFNLKKVKYKDMSLEFKRGYFIHYYVEDTYYYADDNKLNLFCSGKTEEELMDDIAMSLVVQWKMYVECDIDELSKDAVKLRNVFLDTLERGKQ